MAAGKGKAAPRKKSAALRYRRIVPPSRARVRITRNLLIVASCDDDFFLLGRLLVRSSRRRDTFGSTRPNAVANAIGYAQHYSRSHDAVMRVYDAASNVIETHEHAGEFKEP